MFLSLQNYIFSLNYIFIIQKNERILKSFCHFYEGINIMIIRNWHIGEVASLRDAPDVLTISHRTALRLYGVINIKPLRGFFTANADNH